MGVPKTGSTSMHNFFASHDDRGDFVVNDGSDGGLGPLKHARAPKIIKRAWQLGINVSGYTFLYTDRNPLHQAASEYCSILKYSDGIIKRNHWDDPKIREREQDSQWMKKVLESPQDSFNEFIAKWLLQSNYVGYIDGIPKEQLWKMEFESLQHDFDKFCLEFMGPNFKSTLPMRGESGKDVAFYNRLWDTVDAENKRIFYNINKERIVRYETKDYSA